MRQFLKPFDLERALQALEFQLADELSEAKDTTQGFVGARMDRTNIHALINAPRTTATRCQRAIGASAASFSWN